MRRCWLVLLLVVILALGGTGTAWADAPEAGGDAEKGLSLEEVVELALRRSLTVKQAEMDLDRAKEVADATWDAYNWQLAKTYVEAEDLYRTLPGETDVYPAMMQTDRAWRIQQKTFEITRDAIALGALRNYYNIIKKQNELETAEVSLAKAERDYQTVRVMNTVGMATGAQVQGALTALERARSTLEKARGDLEGAYRELNKLIGLKTGERPALTTPLEFAPVEVESIDFETTRALSLNRNPHLWSLKEGYELQRFVWTYTQPAEAGEIDREKAWLNYENARAETRNKMYELYDTLKTLEASYRSAEEGVAAAREGLRTAELRREVGLATDSEVLEARVALRQAEDALLEITSAYALTAETFEKPWLAFLGQGSAGDAGGGGGSASNAM